ncbi:hypothetical protein C8R45DRAFT_816884, partial [Mycena sanguinolenta]
MFEFCIVEVSPCRVHRVKVRKQYPCSCLCEIPFWRSNEASPHTESEKFDGMKWPSWKLKMLAHAKVRGLGGYLDGTIPKPNVPIAPAGADEDKIPLPLSPLTTSVFSKTLSLKEWTHHDEMATSILVLNVKDPIGIGLKSDGTAHDAWKSL